MTLSPALRKLLLTAHVTASVGWFGAIVAFLALAVTGLESQDVRFVQAAYLALEAVGWTVIVPLSLAALLTGVVQSLGTSWGLFRHYWVLIKLVITVLSTILLLVHMQPVGVLARAAADGALANPHLHALQRQLVGDAAAAIAVLLDATTLSVYKPRGLTPYGWRKIQEQRAGGVSRETAL